MKSVSSGKQKYKYQSTDFVHNKDSNQNMARFNPGRMWNQMGKAMDILYAMIT